jgi:hypothetical protein
MYKKYIYLLFKARKKTYPKKKEAPDWKILGEASETHGRPGKICRGLNLKN